MPTGELPGLGWFVPTWGYAYISTDTQGACLHNGAGLPLMGLGEAIPEANRPPFALTRNPSATADNHPLLNTIKGGHSE